MLNLTLTPELEQFVKTQLENGKYTSPEEVILAALRMFAKQENIYKGRFEELQREIMIGVEASERGEVIDSETVFHQIRAKLAQRRQHEGA